jgi:hypothetical protein
VPAWRRIIRWIPTAAGAALGLLLATDGAVGSSTGLSGPGRLDTRVEAGAPDQVLGRLAVTGTSPGMPAAVYQPQPVDVFVDRAIITPGLTEVRLPLETLTISRASWVPRPLTRRKAVDAAWVIDVTGPETSLSFHGRWLVLAYLGTLAGWPEPD